MSPISRIYFSHFISNWVWGSWVDLFTDSV